jgi:hypothetical protein
VLRESGTDGIGGAPEDVAVVLLFDPVRPAHVLVLLSLTTRMAGELTDRGTSSTSARLPWLWRRRCRHVSVCASSAPLRDASLSIQGDDGGCRQCEDRQTSKRLAIGGNRGYDFLRGS